ncbi:hypothetical protein N7519_004748, partial [Penicillium mononematosum]|uniref:uncharacterized protein n=1 Tax=Penicillium mononematosum TaxID=268346 RepID=UPI0025486C7E
KKARQLPRQLYSLRSAHIHHEIVDGKCVNIPRIEYKMTPKASKLSFFAKYGGSGSQVYTKEDQLLVRVPSSLQFPVALLTRRSKFGVIELYAPPRNFFLEHLHLYIVSYEWPCLRVLSVTGRYLTPTVADDPPSNCPCDWVVHHCQITSMDLRFVSPARGLGIRTVITTLFQLANVNHGMVDGEIVFVLTVEHSVLPEGDDLFFARPGDSGALVYTKDSHALVGLCVAGRLYLPSCSYFTHISDLLILSRVLAQLSRCGRTDKSRGSVPVRIRSMPGQSLALKENASSSGMFGGFFEITLPGIAKPKVVGITCFHVINPTVKEEKESTKAVIRKWWEEGINPDDNMAKHLAASHPSPHAIQENKQSLKGLRKGDEMAYLQAEKQISNSQGLLRDIQGLGRFGRVWEASGFRIAQALSIDNSKYPWP